MEGEEGLRDAPASDEQADERVAQEEILAARRKVWKALPEALKILSPEDRLILRMKMDGFTVAVISRSLHLEQKQLYRRIEKLLSDLRRELERLGIRKEDIDDLFED